LPYPLLLCLAIALIAPSIASAEPDMIFSWGVRGYNATLDPDGTLDGYVPVPHAGHDWGASHPYVQGLYDDLDAADSYLGIMLQNDTAPWDGTKDPDALSTVIDYLDDEGYTFHFCFADFEGGGHTRVQNNIDEMCDEVRNHANSDINSARIANYAYYAGEYDYSHPYPSQADRSDIHDYYVTSELDVSMPHCYPYEYYSQHTSSYTWGSNVSPNKRSALFWAPLERHSVAKRNLPSGHLLIPWINGFVAWSGYDAPEPPEADRQSLLKHMRLRGADGYYHLTSGITGLSHDDHRAECLEAWQSLDDFFSITGSSEILNLETDKTGGVEWSGMRRDTRIVAIVSNLSGSAASVDFPKYSGMPASSPSVPNNSHLTLQYLTTPRTLDDMESYNDTDTMDDQGWYGPNPDSFEIVTPLGTGNDSDQAVAPVSGGYVERAWWTVDNPGVDSDEDQVAYTAMLYNNQGTGFAPVNTDGVNQGGQVDGSQQGPYLYAYWGDFRLRPRIGSGANFEATNVSVDSGHWYEVKMVIDQTRDIDGTAGGAYGVAKCYARDLTDGESAFTLLEFDDPNTQGDDGLIEIPLNLGANCNPTNFDGWQIYGYNPNAQLDTIRQFVRERPMDCDMERYVHGSTLDNRDWKGPNPDSWEVTTPLGSGNDSDNAAAPVSGGYVEKAWWAESTPDVESDDLMVYSAWIYNNQGTGFAPVNTDGASDTSQVPADRQGPYLFAYWGDFRLRQRITNGTSFEATNVSVDSGEWYDVQILIDPTRDIDGTAGGDYGVASVYVRNVTDEETDYTLLTFDDLSTNGIIESLEELPLKLGDDCNPTVFDGWQVYGYNQNAQLDNFVATLYPYADFTSGAAVVPEPVSVGLVAMGLAALLRRRR
jgi:hypothetical protein